jgi:hypothetical protein
MIKQKIMPPMLVALAISLLIAGCGKTEEPSHEASNKSAPPQQTTPETSASSLPRPEAQTPETLQPQTQSNGTNSSKQDNSVHVTRVAYKYEGILELVGVPSKATAYAGDAVVARAEVKFDGKLEPGSLRTLEVEETHYDTGGNTIYRGKILFQAQFNGYVVLTETPIEGTRRFRAFVDWPASR